MHTKFSEMNSDCSYYSHGTILSLFFGYLLFLFCLAVSTMFIVFQNCESLTKPDGAYICMANSSMICCAIAEFCYLCGWANWVHNVINSKECFDDSFNAEGGLS